MTDYKKISCLNLIKHTLLDSFEFSVHTTDDLWSEYYLNGIGIDFFVKINSDAIFSSLKESGFKNVIFAHTHPLINDESLYFERGKEDPRENIAYGYLQLPLGNHPTWDDVNLLNSLKEKGKGFGVQVSGVVFAASGVWTFDIHTCIDSTPDESKVKMDRYDLKNTNRSESFIKHLLVKDEFPDYFMEVEAPSMHKTGERNYKESRPKESIASENQTINYQEVESLKHKYATHGVTLDFIPYISKGFNPISIMRLGIEEWERKFN